MITQNVDRSFFFFRLSAFVFRLGKDKVCAGGGTEQSAAPAANKRTLTICSLTELKHVVGLTKQPFKTLPTIAIKLTKLEKLEHGIRRAKVKRVIRLSTLVSGAVDAT
jgi:hypothetical protein